MVCQYHHRLFFITFILLRRRVRQIFRLRVQLLPCHLAYQPILLIFHHRAPSTLSTLVSTLLGIVVVIVGSPAADMIGFMFHAHIYFFHTVVAKVTVVQVTPIAIISSPRWQLHLKGVIEHRLHQDLCLGTCYSFQVLLI